LGTGGESGEREIVGSFCQLPTKLIKQFRMKKNILLSSIIFFSINLSSAWSQAPVASGDTTIYKAAEEMPRFPGCEQLDTTIQVKAQCAQQSLLKFIYQNIQYPYFAREKGIEGTVVVSFVVEKDGTITQPKIVKDIGEGCGVEALRVVNLMSEYQIRWAPGKNKKEAVRVAFTLPVRFKLEEAPPFVMVAGDSVWSVFDTPLTYAGGDSALQVYLNKELDYPKAFTDSCRIGNIDLQLLVRPNGDLRILDMTDYNDLGTDFLWESIQSVISTMGDWTPATHKGRKVPAGYDISLSFIPEAPACKQVVDNYTRAIRLSDEGTVLVQEGKPEEGLLKMSEAIALFPNNAGLLLLRGQTYLDMNRMPEACQDLSKGKKIALVNWYDSLLPLICKDK